MALYLKYRPQNLDQLIGQESVKKTLSSAFAAGKLSHAYLFVGPRGTGKTSTARILAKMVNCESSAATPCNTCSTCLSITNGSNLDLIEIDAASNRGIDDIRALRDNIKLAASSGSKKVYIIDEVHMLTTEAFNALLKTLEEPPSHALFILATTEVHKVPQTILSRVQRLDFKLATSVELMQSLESIAKDENIDVEKEALELIIKKAEGSFRDGVKLLDQLSSIGTKVTIDDVSKTLRSAKFEQVVELLSYLSTKNSREILVYLQGILEDGSGVKELMVTLMDTMRSLIFIKNDLGEDIVKPEVGENKYGELTTLTEKFTLKDLVSNINTMQDAVEKLKTASIQSLPLELAIIEMCQGKFDVRNEKIEKEDRDWKLESQNSNLKSQTLASNIEHPVSNIQQPTSNDDVTTPGIALLQEKWNFVLETIRPYNFSLEALLRHAKIVEVVSGSVVLEVPYSFHQRMLEAPKSKDLLESVLADILGDQVRVSCVIGTRPTTLGELANVEVAEDDEIVRIASEIFNTDS